jgi:hypothetical protein
MPFNPTGNEPLTEEELYMRSPSEIFDKKKKIIK